MAPQNRITDNLPLVADMRSADAQPPCAEAAPPAQDGAHVGAQVGMSADDGKPAGKVSRNATGEGPPKLYLPACGALCDILWWARRST